MKRTLSSSNSDCLGHSVSLVTLIQQYKHHALTVRHVAQATLEEELTYLRRLIDYFPSADTAATLFAQIRPETISAFLVNYAESHGPGSRRWMQLVLRSFLGFAYENGHLERNMSFLVPAVRRRKMARLPRALPDACISKLDAGIKRDSAAGLRDSAIVCLLATYGVRGVQIRSLCLEHVDWENSRIHFPASKGGRSIEQYLTPKAGNRLADYIMDARPKSSRPEIFLTMTEPFRPLPCASYVSAIIHRRIKELAIDVPNGISTGTHGFRHAFATRMTGQVPFKNIVDMLGHRDPSSTLLYGKVDRAALTQAALPWPGGAQ